jgi:hypothetical protein
MVSGVAVPYARLYQIPARDAEMVLSFHSTLPVIQVDWRSLYKYQWGLSVLRFR